MFSLEEGVLLLNFSKAPRLQVEYEAIFATLILQIQKWRKITHGSHEER